MNIIENPTASLSMDNYLKPVHSGAHQSDISSRSFPGEEDGAMFVPPPAGASACPAPHTNPGNGSAFSATSGLSAVIPAPRTSTQLTPYEELPQEGYSEVSDIAPSYHSDTNSTLPLPNRNNNVFATGQRRPKQLHRVPSQPPVHRKRYNPLYIPPKRDEPTKSECSHMTCVLFFVCISITLVALALAVFATIRVLSVTAKDEVKTGHLLGNGSQSGSYEMVQHIRFLEQQLQHSQNELSKIQNRTSDHSQQLSVLNELLMNISKLPGPQGQPGAGNLTRCAHESSSMGGSASVPSVNTIWIPPPDSNPTELAILGVSCSVSGATSAFLKVEDAVSDNKAYKRYRCECSGEVARADSKLCIIHYWTCPLIS